MKRKCGVIGLGWWGQQMCDFIIKSNRFDISFIFDIDIKKSKYIAKKFGTTAVNSLEDIIKSDEIDTIFVFTPNNFHKEHILAIARTIKNIFIEKPIANTYKDAQEIIDACKKNKIILAVGHNVRHFEIFKKVKKMIDQKVIGDIVFIEGNRSRPIGFNFKPDNWRWHKNTCNGGPLIQMAIHLLDTVRYVCGLNVSDIATFTEKNWLKTENPESINFLMKLNQGQLMSIFTSFVTQEAFYINFYGTKGTIYADQFNGLSLQKENSFERVFIKKYPNHSEVQEIKLFAKSITDRKAYTDPTVEESANNVLLVEKILYNERLNK